MYELIKELNINIPVISNVDISHTEPSYPFYIGRLIEMNIEKEGYSISWEE